MPPAQAVLALGLSLVVAAGCDGCEPDAPGSGGHADDAPRDVRAVVMGGAFRCLVGDGGGARCSRVDGRGEARSLESVSQLAVADDRGCAVHGDGSVSCWDGDGDLEQVEGIDAARAVTLGEHHACVLREQGDVRCWGSNRRGQLGDGTTTDRDGPAPVQGLSGATQVAAGAVHTCALLGDGTVRCWGGHARVSDVRGEPHTAEEVVELIPRPVVAPTAVPSVEGVERIAAGANGSCGVTTEHRVVCWPAYVAGRGSASVLAWPSDAVGVAVGEWGKCAVREGGAVVCWDFAAANGSGRVVAPAAVRGVEDALEVAVGARGACARVRSGAVRCWSDPETVTVLGSGADSR